MFKGLRVDSGDNYEQLDLIVEKYNSLNIDPRSKQVIFSNGLNVDEAIRLNIMHPGSVCHRSASALISPMTLPVSSRETS